MHNHQNYYKYEKIKKYRTNIKYNNRNYSITLLIIQEKLQISIKYSSNHSDEIYEFTNFYSLHQLQIINKYFKHFKNLQQIILDLDKLLKKNKLSIQEKKGNMLLSINVLINNEPNTIIFNLFQNKLTDYRLKKSKLKNSDIIYDYNNNGKGYSLSVPKKNNNDSREIKNLLNDLNYKESNFENKKKNNLTSHATKKFININNNTKKQYSHNQSLNKIKNNKSFQTNNKGHKNSIKNNKSFKNNNLNSSINNNINIYSNDENNININNNNENSAYINNYNNLMTRINKLENLNNEKEKRIQDLEDQINKYEGEISKTITYPVYSPVALKSENTNIEFNNDNTKDKNINNDNDNDNNIIKKNISNLRDSESEMNSDKMKGKSINKEREEIDKKLRNNSIDNEKEIEFNYSKNLQKNKIDPKIKNKRKNSYHGESEIELNSSIPEENNIDKSRELWNKKLNRKKNNPNYNYNLKMNNKDINDFNINKTRKEIDRKLGNRKTSLEMSSSIMNDKYNNKSSEDINNKYESINSNNANSNDNKIHKKKFKYAFKPIEDNEKEIYDDKKSNKNKNNKLKNIYSKSQRNFDNNKFSNSSKDKDKNDGYVLNKKLTDSHNKESIKESSVSKDKEEKEDLKYIQDNDMGSNSNPSEKYYINDRFDFSKSQDKIKNFKKAKIGLPMVEREDLKKYINSRIFFTKREIKFVKNKITKGKKNLHAFFDLLYRASIDGDFEDVIISFCEGIYPQLILFYTDQGARFGAYIQKEKSTSFFGDINYKEVPGTCFLVSLNSLKTYDIEKGEIATDNRPEKLCFGRSFLFNDNGSNWFIYTPRNEFLDIKCMIGDKKSNFGEINTDEIVGTKKDYYLKDVEIFKVSLEVGVKKKKKDYVREKAIKVKGFNRSSKQFSKRKSDYIQIKNVRIEEDE